VDDEDLEAWFKAVLNPKGEGLMHTVSELLVFIILTGLRRREASNLKWETVDLRKKCFTVTDTKNNDPLLLPLSDYLYDLLQSRKKETQSEYVFPGKGLGPIQEPKKQIEKFRKASGVHFTTHDLRRTFISVAENCDISPYAIKALVNHKLPKTRSGDITRDYIVWNMNRLREPMQKITDYVLKSAKVKATDVVSIPSKGDVDLRASELCGVSPSRTI